MRPNSSPANAPGFPLPRMSAILIRIAIEEPPRVYLDDAALGSPDHERLFLWLESRPDIVRLVLAALAEQQGEAA